MPAFNVAIADSVLTPGLRADFISAYDAAYQGMYAELSKIADLEKPSDKRTEIYAYFNASPHPKFWPSGAPIPEDTYDSVQFSCTNLKWGLRVNWKTEDQEDDQIGGLFQRVRDTGTHFGLLDERVIFQMLLGTTDSDLLPFIPNAPDGVGLFSAVDGAGNARFGATGGNIVAGAGIGSPQDVKTSIYRALVRMGLFQDGRGQPMWGSALMKSEIVLVYAMANDEVVRTAVETSLMAQAIQNIAATENVGGAAIENILKKGGFRFILTPTQRITDNYIRVFATAAPHKPFFVQKRTGLEETIATRENSDQVRTTDNAYAQWRTRKGYGLFLPYQCALVQ